MATADRDERARSAVRASLARRGDARWRVDLVSYPRSGSTLLRQYLAVLQGRPQASAYPRDQVRAPGPALTDALAHVVVRKTHQLADAGTDLVYLVRDGRNATLSFLFLTYLSGGHRFSRPEELARALAWLDASEGSWADHVRPALADCGRRLLLLHYEELVRDPAAVLIRLAAFAGVELEAALAERCVATARTIVSYAADPLSGYRHQPEPGSIYELLLRHRGGEYWRHLLDPESRRHLHETGATELLLRLGYETSAEWWSAP